MVQSSEVKAFHENRRLQEENRELRDRLAALEAETNRRFAIVESLLGGPPSSNQSTPS